MPDVYAFEPCPFRDVSHAVADRSSIVRHAAVRCGRPRAAPSGWRSPTRHRGLDARGQTSFAWSDIKDIRSERTLLGRKTLHISRRPAGRIDVAPVLPGYEELERQVRAGRPVAVSG